MRKFTICCIIAAILACLITTGCSSKSSSNNSSTSSSNAREYTYELNKDKYSTEYLQLIHAFAEYCSVKDCEVNFSKRSVAKVTDITDTDVTCKGRTTLYSFEAGKHHGDIFCKTSFVIDSIDEAPPHVTDGTYNLADGAITVSGAKLIVNDPISFDTATEDHLGYSSEEIAGIIEDRLVNPETTEPALFGYET